MLIEKQLHEVADLTDPECNRILNMCVAEARSRVAASDAKGVRGIRGSFALTARRGPVVCMARSLGVPMRYFIAKQTDGPALVVAHRIDEIRRWLEDRLLGDQFHPSYTRMVPAHHVTELELIGCPDPNPSHRRFLSPCRERWPADAAEIGRRYIQAVYDEVALWLRILPDNSPIGVCFSGGIDSGAVLLVTYRAMLDAGLSPSRLKAFTLCVDGSGSDLDQARRFLRQVGLEMLLEPVEVKRTEIDYRDAVRVMEDYKPLDVQACAMLLALVKGIRCRYPDWVYLIDGDGGDENFKDYPIEGNPELTIRSVLNNRMLYHEGWGVECIKHSLTYSGGLSRGSARTFAPLHMLGFYGFSPLTAPDVVDVAEGIPFIAMTDWSHERLYELKGQIVGPGVEAVTGLTMPVFPKKRLQHGAMERSEMERVFPINPREYRRAFYAIHEA